MDSKQINNESRNSSDFVLTEYQSHREAFWKSEELGERRVNFFISLTTAILAALAIREKGILAPGDRVDPIFFYGLGALVLFGFVTLMRIIRRNLVSHEQLRALGRIRKYFVDRDQQIKDYLFYEPCDDRPQRKKEWNQIFSLGTGGLAETVALVNSLIVASIIALFVYSQHGWIVGLFGIGAFITAWVLQFIYVKYRYEKERPKKDEIRFPRN